MRASENRLWSSLSPAKWYVVWLVVIFLSTEFFSLFHWLQRPIIFSTQLFFVCYLGVQGISNKNRLPRLSVREKYFASMIIVLGLLTLIQGLLSAPNTTDAMVYHLVRPLYWLQEKTVFQNSLITGHDFMPPLSGYVLLHLLSSGGDQIAFLSQWIAYVVMLISTFSISKIIGAQRENAFGITLYIAAIPMAVYQATSTQIDLVVTALCIILWEATLRYRMRPSWESALYLATIVGLGIATKPTFAIWVFGIGIMNLRFLITSEKKKKLILHFVQILFVILFFQIRWMLQNMHFFSSPFGYHLSPQGVLIYTNEFFSLSSGVVNGIRNIFTELPTPFISSYIQEALNRIALATNVSFNDPRTTWYGSHFRVNALLFPQEDVIASPWHMGLILISLIPAWIQRKKIDATVFSLYFSGWISFWAFSFILKWQPYHNRLLLPFIVMTSIAASIYWMHKFWWRPFVFASFAAAIVFIFVNVSRPFISYVPLKKYIHSYLPGEARIPTSILFTPREEQYFHARPYWRQPYSQLANSEQLREASFQLEDGFVYPLWNFLLQKDPQFTFNPKSKKSIIRQDIQLVDADNHCYGDDSHRVCLLRAK